MKSYVAGSFVAIVTLVLIGGAFAVFYAGNQQIVSTVTTGTAPITVASTTKVTNLNVNYLDGYDYSALQDGKCVGNETVGQTTSTAYTALFNITGSGYLTSIWIMNDGSTLSVVGTTKVTVDGKTGQEFDTVDVFGGHGTQATYWFARYNYNFTVEGKTGSGTYWTRVRAYFCKE